MAPESIRFECVASYSLIAATRRVAGPSAPRLPGSQYGRYIRCTASMSARRRASRRARMPATMIGFRWISGTALKGKKRGELGHRQQATGNSKVKGKPTSRHGDTEARRKQGTGKSR